MAGTNNLSRIRPGADAAKIVEVMQGLKAIFVTCQEKALQSVVIFMGIVARRLNSPYGERHRA
jgi:hypothetical protein